MVQKRWTSPRALKSILTDILVDILVAELAIYEFDDASLGVELHVIQLRHRQSLQPDIHDDAILGIYLHVIELRHRQSLLPDKLIQEGLKIRIMIV